MKQNQRTFQRLAGKLDGRRILLVEDDHLLTNETEKELARLGTIIIGPFSDVDLALDRISEIPAPDAAILDLSLSAARAFPLADELMKRRIPFVFATKQNLGRFPDRYPGFILCRRPPLMEEIVNALFGGGSTAWH
ncbi:response regulator [Aquamicrobium sp. LC103]|uniref:response regulator n=1 Tax=Aquamicrobium sp. LC103 TaxID=1120658 RepID=UPI00063E982E|nr:response regulator [Aquamicrobium sp. LC103]TKT79153.1 response regulator [Aquamicrobium sp. LC103]